MATKLERGGGKALVAEPLKNITFLRLPLGRVDLPPGRFAMDKSAAAGKIIIQTFFKEDFLSKFGYPLDRNIVYRHQNGLLLQKGKSQPELLCYCWFTM